MVHTRDLSSGNSFHLCSIKQKKGKKYYRRPPQTNDKNLRAGKKFIPMHFRESHPSAPPHFNIHILFGWVFFWHNDHLRKRMPASLTLHHFHLPHFILAHICVICAWKIKNETRRKTYITYTYICGSEKLKYFLHNPFLRSIFSILFYLFFLRWIVVGWYWRAQCAHLYLLVYTINV